ncbi:menaquinone-dependent protoporphyrinogen IX dehydrogenase [soil metagenome]
MSKILILYASSHGHTRTIAQTIADRLRGHGARVQMGDLKKAPPPSCDGFDTIVLGSRIHFGGLDRHLRAFVKRRHAELSAKPSYLFSFGMRAAYEPRLPGSNAELDRWCNARAWAPVRTQSFAGALLYRSFNPVMRIVMKLLSPRWSHPKDTSRDHIFTNWTEVADFADLISASSITAAAAV